jgi:hypothetical protein
LTRDVPVKPQPARFLPVCPAAVMQATPALVARKWNGVAAHPIELNRVRAWPTSQLCVVPMENLFPDTFAAGSDRRCRNNA